jgi:ABC-type transport system involved in multi-copper enzyme maturation permease subunit
MFFIRKELSGPQVMFQGLWLILVVEGALAVNEKAEDKTHGYKFLRILPIKDREIVLSKFLIVLLTTLFLIVFNYILYLFIPGPVHLYKIGRILVLVSGIYALILAATSYIIIFRFGHATFVKFVWIVMIITMVGPVLIFESVVLKMDLDIGIITEELSQIHWLIWIVLPVCGLTLFYLLFQTALKAKAASRG